MPLSVPFDRFQNGHLSSFDLELSQSSADSGILEVIPATSRITALQVKAGVNNFRFYSGFKSFSTIGNLVSASPANDSHRIQGPIGAGSKAPFFADVGPPHEWIIVSGL
jgi:hypothetical protein